MLTFWVNNSIFHNHYPHIHKHTYFILYLFLSPLFVFFLCKRAAEGFWIYVWEKKFAYSQKGPLHISKPQNLYAKVYTHLICYTCQDNEAIMNYKSLSFLNGGIFDIITQKFHLNFEIIVNKKSSLARINPTHINHRLINFECV